MNPNDRTDMYGKRELHYLELHSHLKRLVGVLEWLEGHVRVAIKLWELYHHTCATQSTHTHRLFYTHTHTQDRL